MPARLNCVIVGTSRREVAISWASRDQLLERLRRHSDAARIVAAFEAVGASRPVTLNAAEEVLLHEVVSAWFNEVGARNVPEDIADLRHALKDEPTTD